eukprot:XP_016875461.1 vacuolar protein sorting-associated protein 37B isoform X6 [Homo sapiens]
MAGAGSEARFAGLSLVQLNELLEDEGQLTEMVQKMEEACGRGRGEGCLGGREGWRTWPSCSRTSARQPGEHSPSPLSLFIFLLLLILIAESNQNLRLFTSASTMAVVRNSSHSAAVAGKALHGVTGQSLSWKRAGRKSASFFTTGSSSK